MLPIRFKQGLFLLLASFLSAWSSPAFCQEAVSEVKTDLKDNEGVAFNNKMFHAPEMIMVGELPLNKQARQMYPSPVLFDVDNDNRVELVVGDIFGSLNVYENENPSASGDPVWSEHVGLQSTDGQPIKVSNW